MVLTLRGFAQVSYSSDYPKKVVILFKFLFKKKKLLRKKLEIEKTKPTFIISVLKVVYSQYDEAELNKSQKSRPKTHTASKVTS